MNRFPKIALSVIFLGISTTGIVHGGQATAEVTLHVTFVKSEKPSLQIENSQPQLTFANGRYYAETDITFDHAENYRLTLTHPKDSLPYGGSNTLGLQSKTSRDVIPATARFETLDGKSGKLIFQAEQTDISNVDSGDYTATINVLVTAQ